MRRKHVWVGAAVLALAVALVGYLAWPGGGHPATASTAACPTRDTRKAGNPPSADLSNALVPGQPAGAIICRYYGNNEKPEAAGSLARSKTIAGDQARQFGAELNAGIRQDALIDCPSDDGTSVRVIFTYAGGRTLTVQAELGGCGFANNGPTALIMPGDATRQIRQLVG